MWRRMGKRHRTLIFDVEDIVAAVPDQCADSHFGPFPLSLPIPVSAGSPIRDHSRVGTNRHPPTAPPRPRVQCVTQQPARAYTPARTPTRISHACTHMHGPPSRQTGPSDAAAPTGKRVRAQSHWHHAIEQVELGTNVIKKMTAVRVPTVPRVPRVRRVPIVPTVPRVPIVPRVPLGTNVLKKITAVRVPVVPRVPHIAVQAHADARTW